MSAATPISKSSDAGSSNIPEFDDDLLSSTLKDLSPSRLGQEASQNLERALDDFAERFCPSIKNSPEEEKRRFESCLAKLSKQSDLTQSDNASGTKGNHLNLYSRGSIPVLQFIQRHRSHCCLGGRELTPILSENWKNSEHPLMLCKVL